METLTKSEVEAKAKAAAEAAMKATAPVEKKQLFDSAVKSKSEKKEAYAIAGKFFSALLNKDENTLTKDLGVSVDANGGYLAPTEVSDMIVERLYAAPTIRQFATRIPMNSDKMEINGDGAAPTVNWTNELALITQSDPTFTQVTLQANELIGISRMSRQLLADAAVRPQLVDWIVGQFTNAILRAENLAFIGGSGVGQPKGIRQETLTTVAFGGAPTGDKMIGLYHALPMQYRANAVWLMSDDAAAALRTLKTTDGQYLWGNGFNGTAQQQAQLPTLMGRPVVVDNSIPSNLGGGSDTEIYFGDLSYYVIGDREQIFSEVSTQEGESFARHRAAVKVGERVDGRLTLTEAFVVGTGVTV